MQNDQSKLEQMLSTTPPLPLNHTSWKSKGLYKIGRCCDLSIWHYQHDIINMTSSIWHHQDDIINMTSSIWHHQYDIINMTLSIWHQTRWNEKSYQDKQHEWKVNFVKFCAFSFLLFQIQWSLFLLPQIYSGRNYQAITSFSSCSYCSFLRPIVTHALWTNIRFFADLSRQKALQL